MLGFVLVSGPVAAGPASDALATCMVDYLTGKERKELGKWIFLGMSAHPEIGQYTNVTGQLRDESDQFIGNLITRLLTDDCLAEARVAVNTESSVAFASAFELVGKVAMQELMTDPNVSNALAGFEQYLDNEKLESLQATD